ncbi:MAG: hypothetical protein PW734_04145 [Verrucomicrobium sp.]|nr:hypothetical protein [Verrucomicrobium sp.]
MTGSSSPAGTGSPAAGSLGVGALHRGGGEVPAEPLGQVDAGLRVGGAGGGQPRLQGGQLGARLRHLPAAHLADGELVFLRLEVGLEADLDRFLDLHGGAGLLGDVEVEPQRVELRQDGPVELLLRQGDADAPAPEGGGDGRVVKGLAEVARGQDEEAGVRVLRAVARALLAGQEADAGAGKGARLEDELRARRLLQGALGRQDGGTLRQGLRVAGFQRHRLLRPERKDRGSQDGQEQGGAPHRL